MNREYWEWAKQRYEPPFVMKVPYDGDIYGFTVNSIWIKRVDGPWEQFNGN